MLFLLNRHDFLWNRHDLYGINKILLNTNDFNEIQVMFYDANTISMEFGRVVLEYI